MYVENAVRNGNAIKREHMSSGQCVELRSAEETDVWLNPCMTLFFSDRFDTDSRHVEPIETSILLNER